MQHRACMILKYPLEHGYVSLCIWDDMEKIWKHAFDNELSTTLGAEELEEDVAGAMLTENPHCPAKDRERMTQIMFETFQARRVDLCCTGGCSLPPGAPLALP